MEDKRSVAGILLLTVRSLYALDRSFKWCSGGQLRGYEEQFWLMMLRSSISYFCQQCLLLYSCRSQSTSLVCCFTSKTFLLVELRRWLKDNNNKKEIQTYSLKIWRIWEWELWSLRAKQFSSKHLDKLLRDENKNKSRCVIRQPEQIQLTKSQLRG